MPADSKLILFIEDCEQTRSLYEGVFANGGYRVALAADGREGVELAERLRPDVIVTDLDMPVMDGLEAAARIRRCDATQATPIVVLTGSGMRRCILRAYEVGCDAFLIKPCRPRQLLEVIEKLVVSAERSGHDRPLPRSA